MFNKPKKDIHCVEAGDRLNPAPLLTHTTPGGIILTLQSSTINHEMLWDKCTQGRAATGVTLSVNELIDLIYRNNNICGTISHYGRVCHNRDSVITSSQQDFDTCKRFIKDGHYTPFESVSFDILIENFSRVGLAQLTRYRRVGFNVESQKYNVYKTVPVKLNPDMKSVYHRKLAATTKASGRKRTYELSIADLFELIDSMYHQRDVLNVRNDDMRYILANATATRLRIVFNLREFFFIYKERTGPTASPEIRDLAIGMMILLQRHVDDYGAQLLQYYMAYINHNVTALIAEFSAVLRNKKTNLPLRLQKLENLVKEYQKFV